MDEAAAPQVDPIPLLAMGKGSAPKVVDLTSLLTTRRRPLPYSLRVVLENLACQILGGSDEARPAFAAIRNWDSNSPGLSVPLAVTRVMLPDSSGLPALMDLAAARDVLAARGYDPRAVGPVVPVTLVVDHSLIVEAAGRPDARARNIAEEYRRNRARYSFFKWAQQAFDGLRVVPSGTGIIHQIHLEKIARVVAPVELPAGRTVLATEFVLGCDSHTTMAGGIGMLAWGVGGIEGEAAILGLPHEVHIRRVIGVRLRGRLPAGTTTTDLVLGITERLRQEGVLGAFIEFYGDGVVTLSAPDRATIANMAPEFGATCAFFPIDAQCLAYLQASGRPDDSVAEVEAYARATGLWADPGDPEPDYSATVEIDLSAVAPSVAGPKRPQDRVPLGDVARTFREALTAQVGPGGFGLAPTAVAQEARIELEGHPVALRHGSLVIAAITSCTNTSNPSVMIAAGLLARNAVARGLQVPPHVKTSLAPGSLLVEDYLAQAGLLAPLDALGFNIVGFGCTTCSGKSGPLAPGVTEAISNSDLVCAAVLSGNRNFEGRIHKSVRAAYLASPPLVVAFALAGRIDIDLTAEPLGHDRAGRPVMLADIWPDPAELASLTGVSQDPDRFRSSYATLYDGTPLWRELESPTGPTFDWDPASTYIRRPPFFDELAEGVPDVIAGARVLVLAGDSLTTDFITPSGEILPESQAGAYLMELGVAPKDFNAVTQRRGNHEFMARMTFANPRMKNRLAGGVEGGFTRIAPGGDLLTVFDAAERFRMQAAPAIVLAGRDYGMGSSRDWAAKGPRLLGVRVILARSFERIHRSNLIGMGILPMVFSADEGVETLGLSGFETFRFDGIAAALASGGPVAVTARAPDGSERRFGAALDVRSSHERALLREGGIFGRLLRVGLSKAGDNRKGEAPGERCAHDL